MSRGEQLTRGAELAALLCLAVGVLAIPVGIAMLPLVWPWKVALTGFYFAVVLCCGMIAVGFARALRERGRAGRWRG